MAHPHNVNDRLKSTLTDLAWRLIASMALAGCTALGWYLFVLARETRVDSVIAEFIRDVTLTIETAFSLNPVLALVAFPFAVLALLILVALLIWMRKNS